MGQQITATGVVFETKMDHYLILKITNNSKDYENLKYEEKFEITNPEQKIELLCKLIDHADMNLCCKTYLRGPLKDILLEIEKFDKTLYQKASIRFNNLNPYEPYEPYKLLAQVHPNIVNFINNSQYKETYINIDRGIKILDTRVKILNEYAKLSNQPFEELKIRYLNNKNREDCFACCKMFNIEHSEEFRDCQCGYYDFETLFRELRWLKWFDNIEEFTQKFISSEIKIIGLKRKYPEKVNLHDYII